MFFLLNSTLVLTAFFSTCSEMVLQNFSIFPELITEAMSSTEKAGDQPIPLAQRILALQMKNRKKLHMYEASRTSQSEGNKENSLLSTSITARQNKTAPPGQMFDMSKINDSLASAPHNKSSSLSSGRDAIYTPSQKARRPPVPTPTSRQLSSISERHAEKEHSGNRSRALECDNRFAMDAQVKSRSKSVGSKESRAHGDAIPQSAGGMRPSLSTSSLQNKYISINNHSYIWLSLLGKGGSSRVYEVFDDSRGEVCALKSSGPGRRPSVRQCYLNEIELLKSLQGSPYVIKMLEYELREEENTLYVVMEKGDVDLATFLKTRRTEIDSSFIKYHWNEMLRCVKVIHDRKIVHSDLKPANFLLVKGTVKLIDFGIAAGIPNDMTAAVKESQMGTLSYMAPEILLGGNGDGKVKLPLKADVWSLGCILYNIVYGRLPFTMKSQTAKVSPFSL
ncbi:kinase domain protein [Cooperia oncophora]